MHNGRLSNPLDPATKVLAKATSKRKKTEEDHLEIARLEWYGSLYWDDHMGAYIPGENIQRCLVEAAKATRRGKALEQGLLITSDQNVLIYPGPRDKGALWEDENYRFIRSVKVGMSRTMRCRPIFSEWETEAEGWVDPTVMDLAEVVSIVERAGPYVGLGDWRPRYGKFIGEVEEL